MSESPKETDIVDSLSIKELKNAISTMKLSCIGLTEKSELQELLRQNNYQPFTLPVKSEEEKMGVLPEGKAKECVCMFCKVTHYFKSEEEAIDHMEKCPGLQAQMGNEKHIFEVPGTGGAWFFGLAAVYEQCGDDSNKSSYNI